MGVHPTFIDIYFTPRHAQPFICQKKTLFLYNKFYKMSAVKSISTQFQNEPSVFALLVDNISRMSLSEQKLLWMNLNKKNISDLAKEIDSSTRSDNLPEDEVVALVKEARTNARKKKKG